MSNIIEYILDRELDHELDKLLIARGEHPSRVRNPIYSEERELAKDLVKSSNYQNVIEKILIEYHNWYLEWRKSVTNSNPEICIKEYLKLTQS